MGRHVTTRLHRSTTNQLPVVIVVCLLTNMLLSGCGYRPNLSQLARVSGLATLDDQPLRRGTVQFIPDKRKGFSGASAIGFIDQDGRFTLKTAGVKGAIVGFHRVVVDAREEPKSPSDAFPRSLIPATYNDPETSPLHAEVVSEEENVIHLKLSTNP